MKIVWRLCDERYAERALTGEGAFLYPGRWNQRGVPMVYTASTASLAILEFLANVDREDAPDRLAMIELDLHSAVAPLAAQDLPANWNAIPAPSSTQDVGSRWARERASLALRVPSVPMGEDGPEYCVLINPLHKKMAGVEQTAVRPFRFDHRLLG